MDFDSRNGTLGITLRQITELYVTKFYALGEKQRRQLHTTREKLWSYFYKPQSGLNTHFASCLWGQGSEVGPDTCECCYVGFTLRALKELQKDVEHILSDPILQMADANCPESRSGS